MGDSTATQADDPCDDNAELAENTLITLSAHEGGGAPQSGGAGLAAAILLNDIGIFPVA